MTFTHTRFSWLASLGCATAFALSTAAQTPTETTSKPANDDTIVLSEFSVSAEHDDGYLAKNSTAGSRANESLKNIPLTIDVLTNDFLRDTGATDFSSMLNYVAGVSDDVGAALAQGNNSVTIRGLPSTFQLKNFFRWYTQSDPSNIERVEVLKGPAAVLYTQAFPGGAINLVTKTPKKKDQDQVSWRFGSEDLSVVNFDTNRDFGPVQVRMTGANSFARTQNRFEDSRRVGLAPSLSFMPFRKTKVTLMFEYLKLQNNYQGAIARYGANYTALGVKSGDLYAAAPFTARFMGPDSYQKTFSRHFEGRIEQSFTPNLSAQIAFSYMTYGREVFRPSAQNYSAVMVDSTGAYVSHRWVINRPHNSFPAMQSGVVYKFNLTSVENKLFVGTDWAADHYKNNTLGEFVVGSTASRTRKIYIADPNADYSYVPGGEFRATGQVANTRNSAAGYFSTLQSSFHKGLVRSMLGARYDTYKSEYLPGSTAYADPTSPNVNQGHKTSPMAGLLFAPTSSFSLYGLASSSYTPTNGRDAYNRTLPPQEGTGFECGAKLGLFNGRITGSAGYFDTDITNRPETDPNPPADATNTNPMRTTGEIRSRGMDVDLLVSPIPNWDTKFSYNFVNAKVVASADTTTIGQRPTNSAKDSWTVFTRYSFKSGRLAGLYVGAGARYRSKPIWKYTSGVAYYGDNYRVYDLLAGYQWKLGKSRARLAFNLTNLTDEKIILVPGGNPTLAPPRTYSVLLSISR